MKVVIFGASGMVGSGVLLECLDSPEVSRVIVVGRTPTGRTHDKLTEIEHGDFLDFSTIEDELKDLDACFWCLGISAAGLSEEKYTRITYDFTKAAAETLLRLNPKITMCFVSGMGTDSSEKGRQMWARVKGRAENLLLGMGFERAIMFRPAAIQPTRGIKSKTLLYRIVYIMMTPLWPLSRLVAGKWVTNGVVIGRAMIHAAQHGAPKDILESPDINALAQSALAGAS